MGLSYCFSLSCIPHDSSCRASRTPYHGAFDFLINVSHALDKRWTFFTEVFTTQSFETANKPVYTFDEALTCALGPNLQLDFGGNFSVNAQAPREQLYLGLSQRF
jgi:hypothetical protein